MRRILPKAGALTWNRVGTRTCPRSHVEFPQEGWNGAKLLQNWEWYAFSVPTMVYLWEKRHAAWEGKVRKKKTQQKHLSMEQPVNVRSLIHQLVQMLGNHHPASGACKECDRSSLVKMATPLWMVKIMCTPIAFWQTRKDSSGCQNSKMLQSKTTSRISRSWCNWINILIYWN